MPTMHTFPLLYPEPMLCGSLVTMAPCVIRMACRRQLADMGSSCKYAEEVVTRS